MSLGCDYLTTLRVLGYTNLTLVQIWPADSANTYIRLGLVRSRSRPLIAFGHSLLGVTSIHSSVLRRSKQIDQLKPERGFAQTSSSPLLQLTAIKPRANLSVPQMIPQQEIPERKAEVRYISCNMVKRVLQGLVVALRITSTMAKNNI